MNPSAPILVCGLGKSGLAAARLAHRAGHAVHALDTRDTPELRAAAAPLAALGIPLHLGAATPPKGIPYATAIVSPGLPPDGPLLSALRARGITLQSELDFAWDLRPAGTRTIAVTGSNGKSSLVKALADLLDAPGAPAVPCGNYGLPVADAVLLDPPPAWLVIEASSFQLETTAHLRPDIAILLNLLPNHLDRHGSMAEYARLKCRIFARQGRDGVAIVPDDPADLSGQAPLLPGGPEDRPQVLRFSAAALPFDIPGSYFDNPVLRPAAHALLLAARAAGRSDDDARRALLDFRPLPHRNALLRTWRGIRIVDDSKATNLAALVAALHMQPAGSPIRLIAGGRPKETDFAPALPALRATTAACYLIGESAPAFHAAWAGALPCPLCGDLETAFRQALADAAPGDTLLLAPACTAFDQFPSYAVRGERFAALAANLPDAP